MKLNTLVRQPFGDDLTHTGEVCNRITVHSKGGASEEGGNSGSEEDRSKQPIDEEEGLVGATP